MAVVGTGAGGRKQKIKRVRVMTNGGSVNMSKFLPKEIWETLTVDNFAYSSVSYRVDGWFTENDNDYTSNTGWHPSSMRYNPQTGDLTVNHSYGESTRICTPAWGLAECKITVDCFYLE